MPSSARNFAAFPTTPPAPYQKPLESISPGFVSYTRYHQFMADYTAEILWTRDDQPFLDQRYSRRHLLRFDGGLEVPGSSSPHSVRLPFSDPAALDPEEAFVASLSSCHLLWFLSIAAQRGFRVDHYLDSASGSMTKNEAGKLAITRVTLRPAVVFSGEKLPSREEISALHHAAHEECFIANSVRSEVVCEPVFLPAVEVRGINDQL